jgi:hypothetical protein
MPPSTICTRIPQPLNIIKDLSTQIILDFHFGQRSCDIEDLRVCQIADFGRRVDVVAG